MIDPDHAKVGHLHEVLIRMPDRITEATATGVSEELDRGDVKAAAEILAADLDARHPTVTSSEMDLLYRATFWNRRFLDEARYPHLWRRGYILTELPIISRGDGDAPPWTFSDFRRALGEIVEALADRLHPVNLDHARSLLHHGEETLALESVASSLDGSHPAVAREEWEKLRRLLLFYDVEKLSSSEEHIARGDQILAALPVIES
jgi:hypothetical protein